VEIGTEVIRDGGRLRLVEAWLTVEGKEYARAQCQFLKPTDEPPGRVWSPAGAWGAPAPHELLPEPDPKHRHMAEWRIIAGGLGHYGERRVWQREYYALIEGEVSTPFSRVAVAADFASPWIHAGDAGIGYINTDVVVQLHRLPRGAWLGFEATGHEASQGIAVGNCRLHDEDGVIGYIGVTALANRKPGTG
jgi:hypothetical protein